jgi:hypothetical protein
MGSGEGYCEERDGSGGIAPFVCTGRRSARPTTGITRLAKQLLQGERVACRLGISAVIDRRYRKGPLRDDESSNRTQLQRRSMTAETS